jgi:hypothetical protein
VQVFVGLNPLRDANIPGVIRFGVIAHPKLMNRKIFGEDNGCGVRPIFKQRTVLPEQGIHISRIVRAEAAP